MNINPAFIRRECPDFVSRQVNIGFVVMADDVFFQSDIESVQASGVHLSFVRLNSLPTQSRTRCNSAHTMLAEVHRAAEDFLSSGKLDVAFYAGGELSVQLGNDRVLGAVRAGAPGAMVSSIYTATKRAIRAIKAKRVCVATNYSDRKNRQISNTFQDAGVEVVNIRGLRDSSSSHRTSPRGVRNFVLSLDRADADAIVICSTNIGAMEVIEEIEQLAGKPVICSNQIALWDSLRSAGVADKISGYGSLLQKH